MPNQTALETASDSAVVAAEARMARASELVREAEERAAHAAALATSYQDVAETQVRWRDGHRAGGTGIARALVRCGGRAWDRQAGAGGGMRLVVGLALRIANGGEMFSMPPFSPAYSSRHLHHHHHHHLSGCTSINY